jgi:hypothetical protein
MIRGAHRLIVYERMNKGIRYLKSLILRTEGRNCLSEI